MHGGSPEPSGKPMEKASVRRVVASFRPYKLQVWTVVVLVAASVVCGIIPAFLLKDIIDQGIAKHDLAITAKLSIETIIVTILASGFTFWYGYISVNVGQRIMRDLRRDLFDHLQGMSLKFFSNTKTGEIQSRLLNDVSGVQSVVSDVIANALSSIGIVISSIIAMAILDWRLTLLSIGIIPLFSYVASLAGNYARGIRKGVQVQVANLNSIMQETLSVSGVLLTKAVGRRELVEKKFNVENEGLVGWQVKQQMIQYFFFGLFRMLFSVSPALVYWFAAYLMGRGFPITIGTLVSFTALQSRMFFPLSGLLGIQVEMKGAMGLFDRIFDYLDRPQDIVDAPDCVILQPAKVVGRVEMKSVDFSYDSDSEEPTIKSVSFVAEPGQLIALVGPSGAGKTTLAYLIARLYDADSGEVLIDGINVKKIKLSSLEQIVGAVTQETYLINDSIRENLRFAKPDATNEDIESAAKAAVIYDHIANLPDGFDTAAGERGYKLSGGEKQRIAIARALLKNPRILILDEATSSLDTASERLIQNSLNVLMQGRTTFAIAHRLSTILAADQILVIQDGRIVERGRHDQLLASGGLYRSLYEEQFYSQTANVV